MQPADPRANDISVVVPVFNSARTLPELVERIVRVLSGTAGSYEIILVNDGSHDDSWHVIEQLCAAHPPARGIDLVRNHGQHNALLCGIRAARCTIVITLDDDLQHRPEDIPALVAALDGFDVIYGVPEHQRWTLFRNVASTMTKLVLQNAMGATTARMIGGFRAFRRPLTDAFADYSARFVNIDVLLTWGGARFGAVRVQHEPRKYGRSNYTFRRLVVHTFNMMTGFSTLPLQVATAVGFAFTVFGIGVLAYVLGRFLLHGVVVQGFTFLASIIAIFSGAQLFALGVMGEYLARMYRRSIGEPSYVIRRTAP
jgi:undecaprenyl-phosphate 4-deoxy-4-formamido-L-arabinose transferase